jgi:hypothetical protein
LARKSGYAVPKPGSIRDARRRWGAFQTGDRPENLKALLESIHDHIYVKKDARSAGYLFASMVPNEERARKALRNDLPPATFKKIFDYHKDIGTWWDDNIHYLAEPDQKVVKLYGATTEKLARAEQGSVVFAHFPGGAALMAEQILRPGVTFYEAEFFEPGKVGGMKYHLFYWDGKQWAMLGPLWRLLR